MAPFKLAGGTFGEGHVSGGYIMGNPGGNMLSNSKNNYLPAEGQNPRLRSWKIFDKTIAFRLKAKNKNRCAGHPGDRTVASECRLRQVGKGGSAAAPAGHRCRRPSHTSGGGEGC